MWSDRHDNQSAVKSGSGPRIDELAHRMLIAELKTANHLIPIHTADFHRWQVHEAIE